MAGRKGDGKVTDIQTVDPETGEILSSGFELTPTGLVISGNVTYEQWAGKLDQLRLMEGSIQWWIGDALNYGEQRYGEKYAQAVDPT